MNILCNEFPRRAFLFDGKTQSTIARIKNVISSAFFTEILSGQTITFYSNGMIGKIFYIQNVLI